jgi:small subunit ribosomal protein S1
MLKIDQAGERVSLSIKQLEPDPWENVTERFPRGAEFTGKIARKTEFGLFVELEPDVDGLVHVSRLPPGVAVDDPSLAVGETLHGWVREVDTKRRRIALSLREVPDHDPWEGAAKRYADGTVIQGTVESTAPFGVFITLEPGLTGLLPTSEM